MKAPFLGHAHASEDDLPSHRILVIDDSPFSCLNLHRLLEEKGQRVVGEAYDAEQALALYKAVKPDFATLDINMPKKGGLDILKEIVLCDPKALFIIVSAVDQKAVLSECFALGVCEYVPKPVEWGNLKRAILRIMERSKSG